MLPKFLCIGAQKAGTTWLYEQLSQHPDIWLPPLKELHYFSFVHLSGRKKDKKHRIYTLLRNELCNDVIDDTMVSYLSRLVVEDSTTDDWYRAAFQWPGIEKRTTGEITPLYSALPEEGIAHVRRLLGNPLLIYMVREPVARVESEMRMVMERRGDQRSASEQLDRLIKRGSAVYRNHIPRWLEVFPEIHFVPFRQVSINPLGVLRGIEQKLGLPPAEYKAAEEVRHATIKTDLPDGIRRRIREFAEPDRAFIRQKFGDEFAAMT